MSKPGLAGLAMSINLEANVNKPDNDNELMSNKPELIDSIYWLTPLTLSGGEGGVSRPSISTKLTDTLLA